MHKVLLKKQDAYFGSAALTIQCAGKHKDASLRTAMQWQRLCISALENRTLEEAVESLARTGTGDMRAAHWRVIGR